ncbi:MAG: hypothetical protein ABH864_00960 [archaeon]
MPRSKKHKPDKKGGKRKKRSLLIGIVLIVLLAVLVLLVPVLLYQLGLVNNPFTNLHFQPKEFIVKDECAMIVGNLIHPIQDEGICEQRCKMDCDVRGLFFYDFEFTESVGDCHTCKCRCR